MSHLLVGNKTISEITLCMNSQQNDLFILNVTEFYIFGAFFCTCVYFLLRLCGKRSKGALTPSNGGDAHCW